MSNVHRHLLPHVTDTRVATALFSAADFRADNDSSELSAALEGVADATSRDGGWAKAATEAANTSDRDRLDRLARYSQRGVRRAVITNRRVSDETLRYLLYWALDKDDKQLLGMAAQHQPVGRLLDAAGERLAELVRAGMDLRVMAMSAVFDGPVPDLVRLYTNTDLTSIRNEIAKQYDPYLHQYTSASGRSPIIAFDELHRLTRSAGVPLPAEQLWQAQHITLPVASVLVDADLPQGMQRMSFNDCDRDAAVLLVEAQPRWQRALAAALASSTPLPETTVDAILDQLEIGFDDHQLTLVRALIQPRHLEELTGQQADRLVGIIDAVAARTEAPKDAVVAKHVQLLYDAVFQHAGDKVGPQQAVRLVEVIDPEDINAWVTNQTADYAVTEYLRELEPHLLEILARRQTEACGGTWKWLCDALECVEELPQLQQTLLDAAGPRGLRMHTRSEIAATLASWFSREFGGDVERWQIALGLIDGWEATVSELIEAAHALSGGRPEQPAVRADGHVLVSAGEQLGLFG